MLTSLFKLPGMMAPSLPWGASSRCYHSFSINIFPSIQPEPPLMQLKVVYPRPTASCLGEQVDPHLTMAFFHVVVECPLSLFLLRVSKPSSPSSSS